MYSFSFSTFTRFRLPSFNTGMFSSFFYFRLFIDPTSFFDARDFPDSYFSLSFSFLLFILSSFDTYKATSFRIAYMVLSFFRIAYRLTSIFEPTSA